MVGFMDSKGAMCVYGCLSLRSTVPHIGLVLRQFFPESKKDPCTQFPVCQLSNMKENGEKILLNLSW